MNVVPPINITWYLSGPITGNEEVNITRFRNVCTQLRIRGYNIVSPVEVCNDALVRLGLAGSQPWDWYMRQCIIAMMHKDVKGIIMLPDWEQSRGAKAELALAQALNFQVMFWAVFGVKLP